MDKHKKNDNVLILNHARTKYFFSIVKHAKVIKVNLIIFVLTTIRFSNCTVPYKSIKTIFFFNGKTMYKLARIRVNLANILGF